MRIVSGIAGGTVLETLKNNNVRPTTDRVRESLFNILMPRLEDCRFLDLYAGTGANGIESLSRGGAYSLMIDGARDAIEIIERNIQKAKMIKGARIIQKNLPIGIESLSRTEEPFDIIFADPPYGYPEYKSLLHSISEGNLLKPNGLMVLEHSRKESIPKMESGLSVVRTKEYGDTVLSFFEVG